jgi:hypothetical protein
MALRTLLDATGWLKAYNGGNSSLTWPGGTQLSNAVTIAHGLGSSPTSVQITPFLTLAAVFDPVFSVTAVDATNITVQALNAAGVPGAGTSAAFFWHAEL